MFWIVCIVLTLVVLAVVLTPLLRTDASVPQDDPQVAFYKAQLAEIERDVARNVLAADEAERAKTEIARRLIAASKHHTNAQQGPTSKLIAAGTGVAILLAAGGTYLVMGAPGEPDLPLQMRIALGDEARANRPSQEEAEAATP
ncbi:MAG: c-type cytochrome biogenesis protein CcmI, partial [Pseudomonadota bacterium]